MGPQFVGLQPGVTDAAKGNHWSVARRGPWLRIAGFSPAPWLAVTLNENHVFRHLFKGVVMTDDKELVKAADAGDRFG